MAAATTKDSRLDYSRVIDRTVSAIGANLGAFILLTLIKRRPDPRLLAVTVALTFATSLVSSVGIASVYFDLGSIFA